MELPEVHDLQVAEPANSWQEEDSKSKRSAYELISTSQQILIDTEVRRKLDDVEEEALETNEVVPTTAINTNQSVDDPLILLSEGGVVEKEGLEKNEKNSTEHASTLQSEGHVRVENLRSSPQPLVSTTDLMRKFNELELARQRVGRSKMSNLPEDNNYLTPSKPTDPVRLEQRIPTASTQRSDLSSIARESDLSDDLEKLLSDDVDLLVEANEQRQPPKLSVVATVDENSVNDVISPPSLRSKRVHRDNVPSVFERLYRDGTNKQRLRNSEPRRARSHSEDESVQSSQSQRPSSARSLCGTEGSSVFDRLYRKEKRSNQCWIDPAIRMSRQNAQPTQERLEKKEFTPSSSQNKGNPEDDVREKLARIRKVLEF